MLRVRSGRFPARRWHHLLRVLLRAVAGLMLGTAAPVMAADGPLRVPILLYHRFGPAVTDPMTVTTPVFESQLRLLHDKGYQVVPLRDLVSALRGEAPPLPAHSVGLAVDDGHRTVHSEIYPLVLRLRLPVTLFIYPSAISNASYALTWGQLAEMKASGLFDVQSHTFWHPNFNVERRRLPPDAYARFVDNQLTRSRANIEARLGGKVDLLAWPFGIYDADLMRRAEAAGYTAAFSIDRRPVTRAESLMALPRYIVTDGDRGARFEALLRGPRETASRQDMAAPR